MRQRCLIPFCAISLLTLASCSESKYPFSAIEDAERDERLVGVWVAEPTSKDEGVAYLHIGAEGDRPISPGRKQPERALMSFVWVAHDKEFGRTVVTPITGRFFISKIGDDRYANLLVDWRGPERAPAELGYKFMAYKVDGDQLTTWFAEDEPFVKAVKGGALAGKVVQKGDRFKFDAAELTATSDELAAFLKTDAGKKAFERDRDDGKMSFQRLR